MSTAPGALGRPRVGVLALQGGFDAHARVLRSLGAEVREVRAPLDLVRGVAEAGKLPVVLFCAGGIATPADASLVMQLGAEGVFVGSGIFKSEDPATRAAAIVEATTHFRDADRVARASEGLGQAMASLESRKLEEQQLLANRGW